MLTDITPRAISEQCYLNIPKSTHVDSTDSGDIWDGLAHKLSNKPAWEMVNSPSTPHCVLIAGMENMGHLSGCIPRLDRPAILSGRCILYLWWVGFWVQATHPITTNIVSSRLNIRCPLQWLCIVSQI